MLRHHSDTQHPPRPVCPLACSSLVKLCRHILPSRLHSCTCLRWLIAREEEQLDGAVTALVARSPVPNQSPLVRQQLVGCVTRCHRAPCFRRLRGSLHQEAAWLLASRGCVNPNGSTTNGHVPIVNGPQNPNGPEAAAATRRRRWRDPSGSRSVQPGAGSVHVGRADLPAGPAGEGLLHEGRRRTRAAGGYNGE